MESGPQSRGGHIRVTLIQPKSRRAWAWASLAALKYCLFFSLAVVYYRVYTPEERGVGLILMAFLLIFAARGGRERVMFCKSIVRDEELMAGDLTGWMMYDLHSAA